LVVGYSFKIYGGSRLIENTCDPGFAREFAISRKIQSAFSHQSGIAL